MTKPVVENVRSDDPEVAGMQGYLRATRFTAVSPSMGSVLTVMGSHDEYSVYRYPDFYCD